MWIAAHRASDVVGSGRRGALGLVLAATIGVAIGSALGSRAVCSVDR